ncbi:Uncharacterized protein BM_BM17712 [Brugia malayi]|uniref:Uncharacterized protein n=1 Tax=Brugia malayi TaxID=6279 RepID=A0A4E9FXH3_BRUMA|nr:Uncharacterized protein BM_BM17712 [Brugia malayi]VIO97603.1 Uncharacterized protein BM_BM17712 [Brugia malayi]
MHRLGVILFLITILLINKNDSTSLDIALAFARYTGALFTFEEVIEVMPSVNEPLDNIADALRLSPLAIAMANEFASNISKTLMKMAFNLVIFGYLIPSAVIILVTIITCWYIREEIRNLYPMLVPFPIAKKACDEFLQQMDKELIKKLKKKQEEEMAKETMTVTDTQTT